MYRKRAIIGPKVAILARFRQVGSKSLVSYALISLVFGRGLHGRSLWKFMPPNTGRPPEVAGSDQGIQ
jgi:hypothetical protein